MINTQINKLITQIFALILTSCFQPERNCKDYYQGKADTASIRWVNNCEYVLTKLHPKNNQEKKPILIKILTTSKRSLRF